MLGKTSVKMSLPSLGKFDIEDDVKLQKRFTDLNSTMQQYFLVTGR